MNKTEQLAKEWLMRHGYTEDDIIFQSATSPDFILSDGKSIEVKKVNNHTLAIYQSQWEQLQAQADCSIAIFNNISIEPLAVISVCEINPPLFKKNGYVFHGTGKYKNFPLKETGIYKLVSKYIRLAGYLGDKQFGPQLIRRSFGRFWFKDGGDPKSLQLIYGHSSLITTLKYYAAFQAEDVQEIHKKHTPGRVFENSLPQVE